MMRDPKLSVLVPVYNGERYLAQALDSILAQTFTDFELIVIDDGSTDNSLALLYRYAKQDTRLQVQIQEHKGLISALNHGLKIARGSYLARMDADDISMPERFERQVALLDKKPEMVILGTAYDLIDENGAHLRIDRQPETDTGIRWQMLFHCSFAHPSVMCRLSTLRQNDLYYDRHAVNAEDYDLWSRLISFGHAGNLPEPLLRHRRHERQTSFLTAEDVRKDSGKVALANLLRLGCPVSPEQVSVLRDWYYHFPSSLDPTGVELCRVLIAILNRFSEQAGLDLDEVNTIRARWILKIITARSTKQAKRSWKFGLWSYFSPKDIYSIIRFTGRRFISAAKKGVG